MMNMGVEIVKLYKQKKYERCAEMIYKSTSRGKKLCWMMIILSLCLSGLSIYLSIIANGGILIYPAIAVGAIAVGAIAVGTGAVAIAVDTGAVAIAVGTGAVAFAVGTGAVAFAVAVGAIAVGAIAVGAIAVAIAVGAGATVTGPKIYCWIALKKSNTSFKKIWSDAR